MLTPSSDNTSEEPDFEDAALFPCLATGTPQPATTIATAVEILSVPFASPPVPHVSIAPGGAFIRTARERIARAAPTNSSVVSPRTLMPIRRAPICASVASPDIITEKAFSASASLRL